MMLILQDVKVYLGLVGLYYALLHTDHHYTCIATDYKYKRKGTAL